jgi:hypothetical protein
MNTILTQLDLAIGDYIVAIFLLLCGLAMIVAIWGFTHAMKKPLWKC